MRSPGRPPVGRREHKQRFWAAIARGLSSEEAGVAAGVSAPVGVCWFHDRGGMDPSPPPHCRGATCPSHNAKSSPSCMPARVGPCDRPTAGPIPVDDRAGAAPQPGDPWGRMESRATTAQWHADRQARRPKVAKLAANDTLRTYVQDRLAGVIATPDGTAVPGPSVPWIGRRHGRRTDRRWAAAWSPQQIANRLRIEFPEDASMRICHEAIDQALYVQGAARCAAS